jgi:hypothetical protein
MQLRNLIYVKGPRVGGTNIPMRLLRPSAVSGSL